MAEEKKSVGDRFLVGMFALCFEKAIEEMSDQMRKIARYGNVDLEAVTPELRSAMVEGFQAYQKKLDRKIAIKMAERNAEKEHDD